MIEVKLLDVGPNEAMEIVRELRQKGYLQNKDFDFAYHKPTWDEFSYEGVSNRFTLFTFYRDELATWFELTYR